MQSTTDATLKEKLKQVEAELSEARSERVALQRERDRTRAAFAQSPDADPSSRVFQAAQHAVDDLRACEEKIEALQAVQVATLKMFDRNGHHPRGDRNGPRSGDVGGGGFREMASAIDIRRGAYTMDTSIEQVRIRERLIAQPERSGGGTLCGQPRNRLEGQLEQHGCRIAVRHQLRERDQGRREVAPARP